MNRKIEKILNQFNNPGSVYRGAPFWAWNGKLEPEELRRQVRIMHEMGLGGFFMHSRVGLDTPYLSKEWFECINACADEAEKLNMLAYLYDEDRWPSGAAGGLVTKNPEYRMRHLYMRILQDLKNFKWNKDVIAVFVVDFEESTMKSYRRLKKGEKVKLSGSEKIMVFSVEIQKPSDWYNGYTYLDTMNHKAVQEFIKVTHQQYKKYSGKYFGKVIPGIFTDEPNYGSQKFYYHTWPINPDESIYISWTEKLPAIFKKRYGYDILDFLPEIFFDLKDKEISKPRYHYHDCITYLFVDGFARQIGEWCEKNNILFTGHVLSEETLGSQTNVVGSCMRFYEYMQAPGMDLLTEHRREFNTAKQVSSVARQFGRKWRLTETYGCTGWDFPFAGHKALGDWQTALGINLRCQHLSWYTMLGEAKRDYPASIFYQSPWWQVYKKVEDYFARIYSVMTDGKEVRDLLVIHPVESFWAIFKMPEWDSEKNAYKMSEKFEQHEKMFVTITDELLATHIDFDFGDEQIMSRWAKVNKEKGQAILQVKEAKYKAVLVPPLLTIRSSTLKILKSFKDAGGKVVFLKKTPDFIDAEIQNSIQDFEVAPDLEEAIKMLEPFSRRVSIKDENGSEIRQIIYLLREDGDAFYLFMCNTSMEWNQNIFSRCPLSIERNIEFKNVQVSGIPEWKYPAYELDPETGKIYLAETIKKEDGYVIKTSFPALGSRLFIIPKTEMSIEAKKRESLVELEKIKIENQMWDIQCSEKNVFVLDMAYYKIKDGQWYEKQEILKLDREVRKILGISRRGGSMIQPWARKKDKKIKGTPVTLRYVFKVEKIPTDEILFAIERPDLYKIYVNNHKISSDDDCGWWVDRSLKTLRIEPAIIKTGENEIIVETIYNEEHPGFEIVYLLGSFGVKIENNQPIMIEKVNKLKTGDWTQQGLPFYSGNITYVFDCEAKTEENQKIFVRIPDFRGTGIRIFVDGNEAGIIGWKPFEIDITEFVRGKQFFKIGLEILGHRRNSHGPLHHREKWPIWTGPGTFVSEGEEFTDSYQIVPCGLMENPEIVIYRIE